MLTISTKKEDFDNGNLTRNWWLVDATGLTLGRVSSKIASVLRGKHQPFFVPHVDCGDYVVVINAEKIKLTGNKLTKKYYYYYTGFIGGIKEQRADFKLANDPCDIIHQAVKRMLPKNPLNRKAISKLKIFAGPDHPHGANKPKELILTKATRYHQ